MNTLRIGPKLVGEGQPCFIIAEAGVNHNGNMALAMRLIDIAASAGVDAIKFQKRAPEIIYSTEELSGPPDWAHDFGETLLEYWDTLELPESKHIQLMEYANNRGLIYLCSAFDLFSLDFTVDVLKVPAIKVPSCMTHNVNFLKAVADEDLPVICSTGFSTEDHVVDISSILPDSRTIYLQCTAVYPCPYDKVDLRAMEWMAGDGLAGYSGHERGIHIPLAAVALGACVVEKHITADRTLPGCDQAASLEPDGLYRMVRNIRDVEAALQADGKRLHELEKEAAARLKVDLRPEEG